MIFTPLARIIATLGPIGYLPAPGTCATLATLLVFLALGTASAPTGTLMWAVIPAIGLGVIIVHAALFTFDETVIDPQEIVLDEVLGYLLACAIFPLTLPWLMASFVIFRLLDIYKPLGIAWCEQLPGAVGIIADDLLAGFYTQIILIIGRILLEVCFGL